MKSKLEKALVLIAKILSLLAVGFVLLMFLGHIFGSSDELITETGWKTIEIIAALFFPIGTSIGMIIGWKRNLTGGLITIISLVIFFCLILIPRGVGFDRGAWIFLVINSAGFLFTIAGLLKAREG